jgi:hypothetical protein
MSTEFKHTSVLMSEYDQFLDEGRQRAWKELEAECRRLKAANKITIDGNEFECRELVGRAIRSLKGPSKYRSKRGTERWVLVRNAFGCGSTVANGLCREFGFDPDEELRS